MMRRVWALCAALVACPAVAQAGPTPFYWGVGPRIGTHFLPGTYPLSFPKRVNEVASFDKVGTDVLVGAAGTWYTSRRTRFNVLTGLDLGSGFRDLSVIATRNRVLSMGQMDFAFGGGAGIGGHRFKADDGGRIRGSHLPLRGEASLVFRDRTRAYQVTAGAEFRVPTRTSFIDTVGDIAAAGPGAYLQLGLELQVLFGNFRPPRPGLYPERNPIQRPPPAARDGREVQAESAAPADLAVPVHGPRTTRG